MARARKAVPALAALWLAVQAAGPALAQPGPPPAGPPVPGRAPSEPRYLGGMWDSERFFFQIENPPLRPEAQAKVDGYRAAMRSGKILSTAWTSCRPGAVSAMVMVMNSIMVLQSPKEIVLMVEEPRLVRRIRIGGAHPRRLKPSYLGDSVGHWEGDTLVVDTVGYNGDFELDAFALPTSPKLHTIERITKSADGKRVDVQVTIDDLENYSRPFTVARGWKVSGQRHQFEYDCMENPREEEFAKAFFIKDLYRPTCIRYEGEGETLSRIVCRRPGK
ncbi:MAG: hypothetical protein ACXU82_04880 [Caulobacteraceae bacterium]